MYKCLNVLFVFICCDLCMITGVFRHLPITLNNCCCFVSTGKVPLSLLSGPGGSGCAMTLACSESGCGCGCRSPCPWDRSIGWWLLMSIVYNCINVCPFSFMPYLYMLDHLHNDVTTLTWLALWPVTIHVCLRHTTLGYVEHFHTNVEARFVMSM